MLVAHFRWPLSPCIFSSSVCGHPTRSFFLCPFSLWISSSMCGCAFVRVSNYRGKKIEPKHRLTCYRWQIKLHIVSFRCIFLSLLYFIVIIVAAAATKYLYNTLAKARNIIRYIGHRTSFGLGYLVSPIKRMKRVNGDGIRGECERARRQIKRTQINIKR